MRSWALVSRPEDPRHALLESGREDHYALVEFAKGQAMWGRALHELLDLGLVEFLAKPDWQSGDEELAELSSREAHEAIDDPVSWDPDVRGRVVVFAATPEGERAYREGRFR